MQDTIKTAPESGRGNAAAALAAVFVAPTRCFQEIGRGARWLWPVIVTTALALVGGWLSQPLRDAMLADRIAKLPEAQREAAMQSAGVGVGQAMAYVFTVVGVLFALVVCALLFLLVLRAMGHLVAFRSIFTGISYASVIGAGLPSLLAGLLVRLKAGSGELEGMADVPRMGLDLVGGEGMLRGLLSAVNPFGIWWLVVLVYGFAVMLGKTPRQVTATVLIGGITWLLVSGVMAGLGFVIAAR